VQTAGAFLFSWREIRYEPLRRLFERNPDKKGAAHRQARSPLAQTRTVKPITDRRANRWASGHADASLENRRSISR
jgi:hypothetical protein